MLNSFFVTWYSRCHGFHLNTWTRHTSNSAPGRAHAEGPLGRRRFSPVAQTDRRTDLRCRKEPTTTVLQLAALAVARGHKACQWRTAVGRPASVHYTSYTNGPDFLFSHNINQHPQGHFHWHLWCLWKIFACSWQIFNQLNRSFPEASRRAYPSGARTRVPCQIPACADTFLRKL